MLQSSEEKGREATERKETGTRRSFVTWKWREKILFLRISATSINKLLNVIPFENILLIPLIC